MKVSVCATVLTLACGAANAWTFNVSEVAPPGDIVGEHQPLQRVWVVSSFAQLEQLYLAVPGPVFVELDSSLFPPAPTTDTPGVVPGVTPGVLPGMVPGVVPGFVPGAAPAGSRAGPKSDCTDCSLASATIEEPTLMLRKRHRHYEKSEETVVAKIVISGNSTDLLNMFEAIPLHSRRDDGLKVHLKNEDASGEGFVQTKIYLFERNLLRRVTTAFSGDVVLNGDTMALNDSKADISFACVGVGSLYLESELNATIGSLQVEMSGSGLMQLKIPSVFLESNLDVEVTGNGTVALVTDIFKASELKTTVAGSGSIVLETSNLTSQTLEASVYGSGITSLSTNGSVDKETLALSGSGQLLAGSIVARKSVVDVWGDGELLVQVTDKLTVSTSVWGKVGYVNAPPTDIKIKGWWFWREASSIVYPSAVNKVVIYEPAAVPDKHPVYCFVETTESALSDDPDFPLVATEQSSTMDLRTTSLSSIQKDSESNWLFYAFVGVSVLVVNVAAARSWATRRVHRRYTPLL